jgi:glycerate kinase
MSEYEVQDATLVIVTEGGTDLIQIPEKYRSQITLIAMQMVMDEIQVGRATDDE